MARLGVTYHDIARVADSLVEQGKQPTIEQIRHVLGTGSSTTIANYLRQWRADQETGKNLTQHEHLPAELTSVIKNLWQRLMSHAETQVEAIKQRTTAELSEKQTALDKYRNNNQRWQQLHNQWVQEKERLVSEKSTLEQGTATLHKETATLKAQLEEKQERVNELHRLHRQTQDNLEHYRVTSREQRLLEEERFHQQLQQKDASLKRAQEELNAVTQLKQQLAHHLESATEENTKLQARSEELSTKMLDTNLLLQQLQQSLEQSNQEAKQWEKRFTNAEEQLSKLKEERIEQEKKLALLAQSEAFARAEIVELADRNKLLALEKWELAQEKSQLQGELRQATRVLETA